MLVLIALSVAIVALTHWFLTSPYGYWKKRGVPNPEPTVLVGNLGPSLTLKKNLGQVYKEIYDAYNDLLYVGYYKFRKPGIIVRDMDLVKDVLVKEFSSFHDNDLNVDDKVDPLFGRNPFCLRGDKWKVMRSQITSSITHAKIKNMFTLINNVGDNMVKYLEKEVATIGEEGFDAKELAAKFTTDAVATCAFGLDGKSFEDPKAEFREMGKKFLYPSFWTGIKHLIMFILPPVANFLRIKLIPDVVEAWFIGILMETIKYREKNGIVRHDYLDLLITLKKNPTHYGFDDMDVMAQAMTFYGDGFETSSITLSFTLYELASNPVIQKQLREEMETVLKKHDGELNYDAVLEMTYLDQVLSESLRMHSPALFMVRLCTKTFELPPPRGEGTGPKVIIEPGTPVVIPVLGIHYDSTLWPEPDKFDPERFSDENKNSRPKCSFLAFGEGPRICLGNRFALAQTKAALVSIITNFDVKVNKKTVEPIQMDPQYFMTCAKGGVWLNFSKRTK